VTGGRRAALASCGALVIALSTFALMRAVRDDDETRCGDGLVPVHGRCCATADLRSGACISSIPPLPRTVRIEGGSLVLGPSDWEAEGRVTPREVRAGPFEIDVYEATVADVGGCARVPSSVVRCEPGDRARAASGLTRDEAARHCAARGMRLPTEDEWILAAAGSGHRYPWGDTGAVCRRAAFGLATGPCSRSGAGPDTVGAHPDGRTPEGLEDMAGNVAEWVTTSGAASGRGVARGGSWRSALAAELRTWSRLELDPDAHDDRVGVRCARDASPDAGAPDVTDAGDASDASDDALRVIARDASAD
jgi:formylglycine-generating enzyme required for sulfatase activity